MSKAPSSRVFARALLFAPLTLVPPACNGTEADNPFADVVNTPCKADDGYDPAQEQADWEALRAAQMPAARTGAYGQARAALSNPMSFPLGLSCLEWSLDGGSRLEVQIINFRSGCAIEWQGKARVEGDVVTLELENRICAVAACGNCLYDTGTIVAVSAAKPTTLVLSEDASCNLHPDLTTWTLPLDTQPNGLVCTYADKYASMVAATNRGLVGEEFSVCDDLPSGLNCKAGYSCRNVSTSEYPDERCLRACSSDADCTFGGGVACRAGYCALP
jgi:hypothetical protein